MGQAIVDAIKTGFSLIGDLAEMFLDGFSTIIWDSTANSGAGALTTVGVFAFVILGLSVVFTVINLCLGMLRSNTGA